MSTLFCRHNRFTADCPICSKGTVLDSGSHGGRATKPSPRGGASPGRRRRAEPGASGGGRFVGPYVEAGPYRDAEGAVYHVRLERVPGGLRLGEWSGGELRPRVPVIGVEALRALVAEAGERAVLADRDAERLIVAFGHEAPAGGTEAGEAHGASPGRSGELSEELRVERVDDGRLRIGRWLLRPNQGWEAQDAPPMLPAARYAEALREAAARGLLSA